MLKSAAANGLLCYSYCLANAFWISLITGYFYYGFIGEGDWKCYATQDDV